MSLFIDHPDEWIGVPDRWPFPVGEGRQFAEPQEWIRALVDEIIAVDDPGPDACARVAELLAVAVQRSLRDRTRVFVYFESWDGPAYFVEALTEDRRVLGAQSFEEFAGLTDPRQLGAPFAEPFLTTSGLEGAVCYRYLPYGEHGGVVGRVDYVVATDDEVVTLTGAELDLVDFERLKAIIVPLAASIDERARSSAPSQA